MIHTVYDLIPATTSGHLIWCLNHNVNKSSVLAFSPRKLLPKINQRSWMANVKKHKKLKAGRFNFISTFSKYTNVCECLVECLHRSKHHHEQLTHPLSSLCRPWLEPDTPRVVRGGSPDSASCYSCNRGWLSKTQQNISSTILVRNTTDTHTDLPSLTHFAWDSCI